MHQVRLHTVRTVAIIPLLDRFTRQHMPEILFAIDLRSQFVPLCVPDPRLHLTMRVVCGHIEYPRIAGLTVGADIAFPQVPVDQAELDRSASGFEHAEKSRDEMALSPSEDLI